MLYMAFKVLINTFKAWVGTSLLEGPSYPSCFNLPNLVGQDGDASGPSASVKGTRNNVFSAIAPALWNILLTEIRMGPILLVFWKALNTWFYAQAWDPKCVMGPASRLCQQPLIVPFSWAVYFNFFIDDGNWFYNYFMIIFHPESFVKICSHTKWTNKWIKLFSINFNSFEVLANYLFVWLVALFFVISLDCSSLL